MNKNIVHKEVQDFIHTKSTSPIDLSKLILSGSPFENISPQELAQQITGKLKFKNVQSFKITLNKIKQNT